MKNAPFGIDIYLQPTYFVDSDHPDIVRYTKNIVQQERDKTKQAILIYNAVRDQFRYNPYNISLQHKALKASNLLNREKKEGYCIEKACLLNACLRTVDIPSRFRFFNVRNHIGVEKFIDVIKTDVLVFHACSEIYLNENWIKATPAFNKALCDKLGVAPLEFNGIDDSMFQEYSNDGKTEFMEYLKDYGTFHDVPHDMFVMKLQEYYPHFFKKEDDDKCMIK
ncbi:MAG: transglutaminase domain-containing protein [Chitinophagales bacterium]|nr:transglutaminase domain-containing protein [Chitinophagales bacterium]